jgi:phosphohistidine phosphatase
MNLYLLRHGIAAERGTGLYASDADRPLTSKGRRKLRRAAAAMRAMELTFDVILSSPLVRARQTAELVANAMRSRHKLELTELLAPGAGAAGLLRRLKQLKPQNALLVGHEPDLSAFASRLLTGGDGLAITFKKGGLCRLSIEMLRAGRCASLEWLVTPAQLELMG